MTDMGGALARETAIKLLSEDEYVRSFFLTQYLERIGAKESIPALTKLLRHWDESVRRSAAEALGKLAARDAIPKLMERTGNNHIGSITAMYTILVQGSDMEEPIADEVRGILDGHVILNRDLGARNHWPAIDVLPSLSRVMSGIASDDHKRAASKMRQVMATYEKSRDLILLGAYQYGTDPKVDEAIDKIEEIEAFLRQGTNEASTFEETVQRLVEMFPSQG
jgi:flagellar biosynthesis/type III secretory pathway ATPase